MGKQAVISVTSKMVLEPNKVGEMVFKENTLSLDLMGNIEKGNYIGPKGEVRKHACKPITTAILVGLASHIRASAAKGWWTEEDHLKHIIQELGREFASPHQGPELSEDQIAEILDESERQNAASDQN